MQQELSGPPGLVVETIGLDVFRDIASHQPDLAVADPAVRLVERDLARTETLHLAADQLQAAFQGIEHDEVVAGLAVLSDHPFVRARGTGLALLFLTGLTRDGAPFT